MLLWRELSSSLSSQFPPKPLDHSVSEDILSEFGGRFQEICKTCFYRTPQKICPRDSAWACRGHWSPLLAHVVTNGTRKEQYTEIRPCPGAVKLFSYCRPVSAGEPCKHTVDRCVFAHSDVELAVWEAEQHGGLARGDLLRSQGDGQAGEEASQPGVRFYCRVCLVTCSSQESFENHCSSVEHRQLITTNCLVQWTYRTPPYDPKALACDYGQDCAKAHSIEELEEWIQRVKLAEESRKSARQGGLLAYQDRLLAEYQESYNEVLIELEGVVVTCQQPLKVFSEDKKMRYQWIFTVHSQVGLKGEGDQPPLVALPHICVTCRAALRGAETLSVRQGRSMGRRLVSCRAVSGGARHRAREQRWSFGIPGGGCSLARPPWAFCWTGQA
uniref:Uncharacterized protein n=1 Tax=Varanus komodoensis TaxID=61221 RepID=A0A8D2KR82_VARKO